MALQDVLRSEHVGHNQAFHKWFAPADYFLVASSVKCAANFVFEVVDPGISKPGGAVRGAVEILGQGFVLILPFTYTHVFVVRIMNNIHIVSIVC